MSRALLMVTQGDMFLVEVCLSKIAKWIEEVDRVYVHVNTDLPLDFLEAAIDELGHDKILWMWTPERLVHGPAISKLMQIVQEDEICIIEDDCLIFKSGVLTENFDKLTHGAKLVGSPRHFCTPWISERAKQVYGLDYIGWGDHGPAFWPNMFFCRKDLLERTDMDFRARSWPKGTMLMDAECPSDQNGDTFVSTSLQLRELVKPREIAIIPQYHCNPDNFLPEYRRDKRGILDGKCGYFHVGSLSSFLTNLLLDERGVPLGLPNAKPVEYPKLNEFEVRTLAMQLSFIERTRLNAMPWLDRYVEACDRLAEHFDIRWMRGAVRRQYDEVIYVR